MDNQLDRNSLERLGAKLDRIETLVTALHDDVLTMEAAQALTGLSRTTLYDKIKSRNGEPPEIAHYKRDRRIYFLKSDLVRWITQDRTPGRDELEHVAANDYAAPTRHQRRVG